ncbi:MAG TPA: hypothetical protein VHA56_20030 [Mucilaginibacter sp.]|nr:hypothetical protein [Mucilaginibacter sp.]
MLQNKLTAFLIFIGITCLTAPAFSLPHPKGTDNDQVIIKNSKLALTINLEKQAVITSMTVNGQKVISNPEGIFTSVTIRGTAYSSRHLLSAPVVTRQGNTYKISGIRYGKNGFIISEDWTFSVTDKDIKWSITRDVPKVLIADEAAMPVFNFDSINTWEGACQGYGGLAWFYLFNTKLCTYGVHTRTSNFWNSKTGNGLQVSVDAPGQQVAMKYTRTADDKLAYAVSVSANEMKFRLDSGTNRRRFIPNRSDIWAPFSLTGGITEENITLSYFDFNDRYGRGKLAGIDGQEVGAVLNTIARIGVIDSLHYGGNSWHTPYGPICLHEQYIAQLGLGIDDPDYINGYKSCLDFYRDHAIEPDGRVYARWAYTDEDMMPGKGNKYGFYEAQWGILMDSNPDFVANVADLYNLTGDKAWVKTHQQGCEKALDWILNRDSNHNGLVEMMTDNESQKKSSDWIDIIWASYENAFVNAKLYHALVEWADIERQLNNPQKASYYADFAAKLKASFNKPITDGGFWDAANKCYVHWIDKDGSVHGRNMVTPVNFMAIAYGICDDRSRQKIILDTIEAQMEKEKLFFWPLAMYSYAPGEGKEWQFPFPSYENGDIFLSWGSIAVKAYAGYDPALALKYVKNVLRQYSKDGLAYQRYGRVKQDGLGDDILSGNSLSIVGLYQAIYGVNPLYNRLYLDPHITPELSGTRLTYRFRNKKLTIGLDNNSYSISSGGYKVTVAHSFGFNAKNGKLYYFNGDSPDAAMQVMSAQPLALTIKNWSAGKMEWTQSLAKTPSRPLTYVLHQLVPDAYYKLVVGNKALQSIKASREGDLTIKLPVSANTEQISISR